uniref:Uncharacterized protein n=1 Tax=Anopheles culicifacies TaxID=139723 RepID=A0A182MNA1_9DIPT
MRGNRILQALVLVLSATSYFPYRVYAQCGLGSPHMLSLEDYDSDEVIPIVRRLQMPEPNSFRRNYRSHPSITNPRVLATPQTLPLTDDLVKQLQRLLTADPNKKIIKRKLQRTNVLRPAEKYTNTATTSTVTSPSFTTPTMPAMSTMSTTNGSTQTTETSNNSREIGKKWFKQLLQEAIDNVLRKNTSEDDELDEIVDQMAAGSGVYRHETSPTDKYKASTLTFRNSLDHLSTVQSDMGRVNFSTTVGNQLPSLTQWHATNQFGSVAPYVVNIFNNTKIGYILMKVSNDSEIRVESQQPENTYEEATTDDYIDRRARKILTGRSDETHQQQGKLSTKNYTKQRQYPQATKNQHLKHPYFFKTTPPMPMAGGSHTMEPPFFNILKTPDNEPLKYRVLLRNNDALPEKGNVRVPHPGSLPKSQHAVKILTGDNRRPNHANGRQGTPKRKPLFYSEEKPTILRSHHPLNELVQVGSVEFEPESRSVGRYNVGRVARKYDFKSLEEELPLEESDITYPDTNTVTQRTAKVLASGKHNLPALKSNEKRQRTTPKPYTEAQRYNFRRTFGTPDSDTESNEHSTTPASSSSRHETFSIADLPGDDVLFNQATANVFVKAKKDSRVREDSYRRQQKESDESAGSLNPTDAGLNDLFERGKSRSKRILKKSDTRWESSNSSEEEADSASS